MHCIHKEALAWEASDMERAQGMEEGSMHRKSARHGSCPRHDRAVCHGRGRHVVEEEWKRSRDGRGSGME
jgi:hypothetical protein